MTESKFSLSYEELEEIVLNVARQYAKDIHMGSGYSHEKFEEYRQELFLHAYDKLTLDVDAKMTKALMYRILWNRATDIFNRDMNISVREQSNQYIGLDIEDLINTEEFSYYDEVLDIDDGVSISHLVKLLDNYPSQLRKFVMAKLILAGVEIPDSLDEDPDYMFVKIEIEGVDRNSIIGDEFISIDDYILSQVNGYSRSSSRTGGPGSFKSHKKSLREDVVYQLNLDPVVKKEYSAVICNGDCDKVVKVKAYDYNQALDILSSKFPSYDVLSIEVE